MNERGRMLEHLDRLIGDLQMERTGDRKVGIPADQRKMAADAMVLLVQARALLRERRGGTEHVREG